MGAHTRQSARATIPPNPAPRREPDTFPGAVAASWAAQPWSARLLRTFLGVTFVYAGWQKLSDPGYLHRGSLTYVGSQLQGFANGSPIGALLRGLSHAAVPVGIAVALGEIAIGLGTLLGVAPVAAAVAGCTVNAVLLLSATWHVHPYFLGSDSIYAVAWLVYAATLLETGRRTARPPLPRARRGQVAPFDRTRRDLIRGAVVGTAMLFLGGVAAAASHLAPAPSKRAAPLQPSHRPHTPTKPITKHTTRPKHPTQQPSTGPAGSPPPPTHAGRTIARIQDLPIGGAAAFWGPGGEPGVVLRLDRRDVVAYSRICTHAGCEVGYDPSARLLVCPCHGAEFDPSDGARPVSGPAPTPLERFRVLVDRATGDVVLPAQ